MFCFVVVGPLVFITMIITSSTGGPPQYNMATSFSSAGSIDGITVGIRVIKKFIVNKS